MTQLAVALPLNQPPAQRSSLVSIHIATPSNPQHLLLHLTLRAM
jgi:hypothetical protein